MESSPMASLASPTMPGAFIFTQSQRRLPSLSIQTSVRPISAYSTDTAYYSPDDAASPASLALPNNRPFSALDTDDDSLNSELAVLERLRMDVRKNLSLRPLASRNPQPLGQDSPILLHYSTAPNSPSATSFYSPSPFSPALSSSTFPTSNIDSHPPSISPSIQPLLPSKLDPLLSSPLNSPLILDTRPQSLFALSHLRNSVNIAIPSLILKRFRQSGNGLGPLHALKKYIANDDDSTRTWDSIMSTSSKWNGDVLVLDEEMDESDPLAPNSNNADGRSGSSMAWSMLPSLPPVTIGQVLYLKGGLSAARQLPELRKHFLGTDPLGTAHLSESPSDENPSILWSILSSDGHLSSESPKAFPERKAGLFALHTESTAPRTPRIMQEDNTPSTSSSSSSSSIRGNISLQLPSRERSSTYDFSPSPSPSVSTFPRSPRKSTLGIDTSSTERLRLDLANMPPKLHLRTMPTKSATLGAPLSLSRLQLLRSPSHPNFVATSSPSSASSSAEPASSGSMGGLAPLLHSSRSRSPPSRSQSLSPFPPSPSTARPPPSPIPLSPASTSSGPGSPNSPDAFIISTILPNFLFLGPELTSPEQAAQLQALGVKRILNMAAECEDDLGLSYKFERYLKIPMRDIVEEENVAKGVREVCQFLDDARLHSSPTYVHCKAGKSRSVTAVMAYLIHANHWPLSRAYTFVTERRKGISPNIGFVSELMSFEEVELGGKSIGVGSGPAPGSNVVGDDASNGDDPTSSSYGHGPGSSTRRPSHIRESLPPTFQTSVSTSAIGGSDFGHALPAGGGGDPAQEMEIKDSEGRYRHARRAPVDELTLQPMRRVSKAGLESSSWT